VSLNYRHQCGHSPLSSSHERGRAQLHPFGSHRWAAQLPGEIRVKHGGIRSSFWRVVTVYLDNLDRTGCTYSADKSDIYFYLCWPPWVACDMGHFLAEYSFSNEIFLLLCYLVKSSSGLEGFWVSGILLKQFSNVLWEWKQSCACKHRQYLRMPRCSLKESVIISLR
jgi:hypothetical protein